MSNNSTAAQGVSADSSDTSDASSSLPSTPPPVEPQPESSTGGPTPGGGRAGTRSGGGDRPALVTWRERIASPEGFSWILATLISAAISAGLAYVILSHPIPPGGDPGTWLSTGWAYVGGHYPSQVVPLAYPPVLFPLLGLAILATGSPITAAQVFAPTLYFVLGLSVFYLATRMLRSRAVALVVLAFVMLDPQLIQMVFWGAYPNLLGFVFMYLAMAGLVLVGSGSTSRGAALFWVCGALTVLTHSLAGLVLAGTTFLALLLSWPLGFPVPGDPATSKGTVEADSPSRLTRGLFGSPAGRLGLIGFAITIGGYYVVTALAHVTHPDYFVSSSLAFQVIGLGGTFHALFPGFNLVSTAVVDILALLVIVLLLIYAILLEYRRAWLTTPMLVLVATGVTILVTPVAGWILRIVTDYTRFGFFLLVPAALSLGYLIDRGWVSNRRGAQPSPVVPDPPAREPPSQRWARSSRHPRRATTLLVIAFILGLLIAGTITAPAMGRLETTFTRVGHDQNFMNALNAIQQTGTPGSILTVPGADKWARAITDRNVYAPYTQAAFLFYQTQILDSELSYYALTSHYAITNGLVTGQIRGIVPSNVDGIPDYGAYIVGAFRPVLRIPPNFVTVNLVGATNHTVYQENLTGAPAVTLPSSSGGGPIRVSYVASNFVFTVYLVVAPGTAQMDVTFNIQATGSDLVQSVDLIVVPSDYTSARVWPGTTSGTFNWETQVIALGPLTTGNVTPTNALVGITALDPETSTPAVLLSFHSADPMGASSIPGTLVLSTPAASTLFNDLPPVIVAPLVWSELGIRFVLMRNPSYAPSPSVAFPGEVAFLQSEFGMPIIYQNVEWSVLEVPFG